MNTGIKTTPLWYYLTILVPLAGGIITFVVLRKNDFKKAKICLIFNLIIWAILISVWGGLLESLGTENPFYVVSSESMIPNLNIFDVVVTQANFPFENIHVGDIILFDRPIVHDKVLVHRVAEILNKNPFTVRTKGDANPGSITGTDFPITKDDYIGKVVYVIPQIGYLERVVSPPINLEVMAVILVLAYYHHFTYRRETANLKQS